MNHHSMESPRIGRKLKQGHSKCEVTILACKKKLQIQGFVWCVSYHVACIWFELIWTTGLSTALQKTRLITMKRKVFAEKDLRAGCSKRLIWRVVMSLCSAILLQHWPHQLPDQDKTLGLARNFESLYCMHAAYFVRYSVFCNFFLNLVSLERFLFLDVMMSEWLTCYIGAESWDGPFTSASQH